MDLPYSNERTAFDQVSSWFPHISSVQRITTDTTVSTLFSKSWFLSIYSSFVDLFLKNKKLQSSAEIPKIDLGYKLNSTFAFKNQLSFIVLDLYSLRNSCAKSETDLSLSC